MGEEEVSERRGRKGEVVKTSFKTGWRKGEISMKLWNNVLMKNVPMGREIFFNRRQGLSKWHNTQKFDV